MAAKPESLEQGVERLGAVVREVRERQREVSGNDAVKPPLQSPSEQWAQKYLSQGFGPDMPAGSTMAAPSEAPTPEQQALLMQELKARVGASAAPVRIAPGRMRASPAMERPFAPAAKKRSFLARLFGG